ncbi:MAG: thiamine pyrophosphate-binding protein [Acidimicrobiales bacterium]
MVAPDSAPSAAGTDAYEVIAAFAAGLVERGVRDVVISPGSRSTPLAVTLHAQPDLTSWIQIDERSAGFFALGQAKATGRPSVARVHLRDGGGTTTCPR